MAGSKNNETPPLLWLMFTADNELRTEEGKSAQSPLKRSKRASRDQRGSRDRSPLDVDKCAALRIQLEALAAAAAKTEEKNELYARLIEISSLLQDQGRVTVQIWHQCAYCKRLDSVDITPKEMSEHRRMNVELTAGGGGSPYCSCHRHAHRRGGRKPKLYLREMVMTEIEERFHVVTPLEEVDKLNELQSGRGNRIAEREAEALRIMRRDHTLRALILRMLVNEQSIYACAIEVCGLWYRVSDAKLTKISSEELDDLLSGTQVGGVFGPGAESSPDAAEVVAAWESTGRSGQVIYILDASCCVNSCSLCIGIQFAWLCWLSMLVGDVWKEG